MSQEDPSYTYAIKEAHQALQQGELSDARRWASVAAELQPDHEDPWLILAAVASPRASIEYLNRALAINPASQRARRGMLWAVQRYRAESPPSPSSPPRQPVITYPASTSELTKRRPMIYPWILLLGLLLLGMAAWLGAPMITSSAGYLRPPAAAQITMDVASPTANTDTIIAGSLELPALGLPAFETASPTFAETALPTSTTFPTATNTPAPTDTPLSTDTPLPSATPLPTDTPWPTDTPPPTELPTQPPEPTEGPDGSFDLPNIDTGEHWIDVDLSQQRVYAYEGSTLVRSFVVSTGKRQTPTVTGKYRIYVKYRTADMRGPGYFLEDVPFVMYFYKGYGLHGTYWHNNFGTPMSHGCVNFKPKEAKWLFEWASVGTIVNVHK